MIGKTRKMLGFSFPTISTLTCGAEALAAKDSNGPWAKATTWDDSQLRAAQHALQCRVTLIQGPPGTGKTFIGCKLLQMFLPQSRVLVLTYKNHVARSKQWQFISIIENAGKGITEY